MGSRPTNQTVWSLFYTSNDTLDDPAWTPMGVPVAGTGNPLDVNDNNNNATNRFYRLKITQP
ncbi:MAG: hypothetical protein ABSH11_10405 [Verrucomicrobiota bacterium]|jgi:hypothetical protein